ncbi:winged helix-turn-helix transcriptional regulator [Cupriavidus sp. CP313]
MGTTEPKSVALLDADAQRQRELASWLRHAGHEVSCFSKCGALAGALQRRVYDAVMLDWDLACAAGHGAAPPLRQCRHAAVLVLAGDASGDAAAAALLAGADAFLRRPLCREETLARLRAVLRRCTRQLAGPICVGVIRLDRTHGRAWSGGAEVRLSATQFALAARLLENAGHVVSARWLCTWVWGEPDAVAAATIARHVRALRRKLGIHPANGLRLARVNRHGYRLDVVGDSR